MCKWQKQGSFMSCWAYSGLILPEKEKVINNAGGAS